MKKIFVSLFFAIPAVASAQSVFTVETDGKKYSFPLENTVITVTDEQPSKLTEAPVYKHNLEEVNLFGSLTSFGFKPMTLVADYVWGIKIIPEATKMFKFQAKTNTNADLYFAPVEANQNIAQSGTATKGGKKFFNIEEGYEQNEVLLLFDERTNNYSFMGLAKAAVYETVDFEGEYWNALIDPNQGTGKLLYGESGMGYEEDNGVYEWTDAATQLHSKLNESLGYWAYWNGGVAVSNYTCNIADGSPSTQLSLPTGMAAHSGNNFVVAYGYNDGGWDSCPVIDFKDGVARKIKGLWVTNNSYFLNSLSNGDSYNSAATEATFIDVTFEGFGAAGLSQGKVKCRLQDGKTSLTDWKYVDLSSLGAVNSLKVNYEFSDDQKNSHGFSAPAYVAIDDVQIYKQ